MADTTPPPTAPLGVDDSDSAIVDASEAPAEHTLLARCAAEALGTFGLVLTILGVALYAGIPAALIQDGRGILSMNLPELSVIAVAIGAGLVLTGLIISIGHISGGHFNPAVSLGAAITGSLSALDMLLYWGSQLVGGIVAGAVIFVTMPARITDIIGGGTGTARDVFATTANGFDTHSPMYAIAQAQITPSTATFDLRNALVVEAIATAVFVAVTIGVVSRRVPKAVGPFAVGSAFAAMLLVTGPVTGGGLNPARSLASAVFGGGGALGQVWVFMLAPLIGAAIAGLFAVAFAPIPPVEVYADEDVEVDFDDVDRAPETDADVDLDLGLGDHASTDLDTEPEADVEADTVLSVEEDVPTKPNTKKPTTKKKA